MSSTPLTAEPDGVVASPDGRLAVHVFALADETLLIPVRRPSRRAVLNADRDAAAAAELVDRVVAERLACGRPRLPASAFERERRRAIVARYWPTSLTPHVSPCGRLASLARRPEAK